jgi:hypothetical protein
MPHAATRNDIVQAAEQCDFTVLRVEPGPGTRADVVLKCERTAEMATIGLWPEDSEVDLFALLARVAGEIRGRPDRPANPHAWLL